MDREDIIRLAREAEFESVDIYANHYGALMRFAALVAAAEREKVARWMMERGYATGHGDSTEDLLQELDWQIAENWNRALINGITTERETIAQSLDKQADLAADEIDRQWAQEMAAAVRARGDNK